MTHQLPTLDYEYNALEPHFDEQTMRIHHTKHHQTYVDKLNAALEKHPELKAHAVEDLLTMLDDIPEDIRTVVRNHGGGHHNHSMFWKLLKKDTAPSEDMLDAITKKFGSLEKFKEQFTAAAIGHFGSGWAWLVLNNGQMEIMTTANQDSPLSQGKTPIIGLDLWEHSFYLRYQNRKPDYISAWWNVLNWEQVEENINAK